MTFIYPKRNNASWIYKRMEIIHNLNLHLGNHNYESIETLNICKELHDKILQYNNKDLYEILIAFQTKEKTKTKLAITIE